MQSTSTSIARTFVALADIQSYAQVNPQVVAVVLPYKVAPLPALHLRDSLAYHHPLLTSLNPMARPRVSHLPASPCGTECSAHASASCFSCTSDDVKGKMTGASWWTTPSASNAQSDATSFAMFDYALIQNFMGIQNEGAGRKRDDSVAPKNLNSGECRPSSHMLVVSFISDTFRARILIYNRTDTFLPSKGQHQNCMICS